MRVRLTVNSWNQPTDKGRVLHSKGDLVDVPDGVGEWLVGAGSAVEVEPEKEPEKEAPKPAARGRRKAAAK